MIENQSLRRRVFYALEDGASGGWLARPLNLVLAGLILLSSLNLMLQTVPELDRVFGASMAAFEQVTVLIFTAEYLVRLWCAPEARNRRYTHPLWGRLRYALTPLALLDLVAILPFYLDLLVIGTLGAEDLLVLRLFRLARMMRILRLVRYSPALATLGVVLHAERRSWMAALFAMMTLTVIVSTLMWMVESTAQPEKFGSIPQSLWWGITTLTTVGYGDVTPVTPLGKIFGGLTQVLGMAMFTLPAAILASGYARELQRRDFAVTHEIVRRQPPFDRLDAARVTEITALLYSRVVPGRYAILRRGEAAESLYFIAEGEVEVELRDGTLRHLGHGEFFGEMAVFEDRDRHESTVTSLRETHLLVLERADFEGLLASWPDLRAHMQEVAARRRNETGAYL